MANHQIPLVEHFGVSKTLLSQIANSPYFKKFDSTVFSKILFKPGYPLQSVELIELQDIIQEQIRKFGNHIFKDGSIVTSSGGLDVADCQLYELEDGADETVTFAETDIVSFIDRNTGTELLTAKFVDFRSARIENGVVVPTMIGLLFNDNRVQNDITTTNAVDVYKQNVSGVNTTLIGTLNTDSTGLSIPPRDGKYANIGSNIFYVSGYFTNITEQNHIFAVDNISTMDVEVGVELTWRIVDTTDDDYKEQLFDPAQNSLNDNTPGADRLILQLQLTDHPLNYEQQETDWKFIPLLKYDNGGIVFRTKYPFYSVLGDTLARRTYEINGNFVIDNFKLEVKSDLLLDGTHQIISYEDVAGVNIYTIEGTDTSYLDLIPGNYVMFGNEINYNRLLLITEVESNSKMKLSDIHYDNFEDIGTSDLLSPNEVGNFISLRDEEKLNYVLSEGKAYVKGYRFETSFTTRLNDDKARTFASREDDKTPSKNYLTLDNYVHTDRPIEYDNLDVLDLHCTRNGEIYEMNFTLGGFGTAITLASGNLVEVREVGQTTGAIFESVDGISLYRLLTRTKTNLTGLPVVNNQHIITVTSPAGATQFGTSTNAYVLTDITKISETPYRSEVPYRNASENYTSKTISNATAVDITVAGSNPTVRFTVTSGSFESQTGGVRDFVNGDFVIIKDTVDTTKPDIFGYISNIRNAAEADILTYPSHMTISNNFSITKPSYFSYYNYQYNSTLIGNLRANYIGVSHPERLGFSHFDLINTPKQFIVSNFGTTGVKTITPELSIVDDVYIGMYIENNGRVWEITDYVGSTQTFTLNVNPLTNPFNFSIGDTLNLVFNRNNIKSVLKSTYNYDKEFYGNININSLGEPSIGNESQKKFIPLIESGSGEVKTVDVDDYSIFFELILPGTGTNSISTAMQSVFRDSYTFGNDTLKVYAAEDIQDTSGLALWFTKGELIPWRTGANPTGPIVSATITGGTLEITFASGYVFTNTDSFIVHGNAPVDNPPSYRRDKTLVTVSPVDSFQVAVDTTTRELIIDNNRYYGGMKPEFELKHSDVYRIRKISVGLGQTTGLLDMTDYFDLDTGQRDSHYDYGRIVLKPFLHLPTISPGQTLVASKAFYYFEVEYDYFESTDGHYFTVDSYNDIHYRKIPTYIDPIKNSYPLRNVIDIRPVRKPKGSIDYENEVEIVTDINLNFDYYLNENKVISLEGNGSSDIALQFTPEADYQTTDYGIKLYDVTIPAYTFNFEDIEYKLIDNRNYTMKDISKLQKRIENLEDIVQLNALELQALQTNLTDSNGDPRYTNGLIVDMFSGFAIAKVNEDQFSASIDIKNMKLYPAFDANNVRLKPSPTAIITSTYPTVYNNIVMLPVDSHTRLVNTIDTSSTTKRNTDVTSLVNGKLTLHPFSDTWFSTDVKPTVLLNEDNQFKNWKEPTVSADKAFTTQWNLWEQFWSGEQIDKNVQTIANATLAQKTGQMVNNKNNIEKIINDKKINTTLSLANRELRIGFVAEQLNYNSGLHEITVNGSVVVFNQGQRLEVDISTSSSVATVMRRFLNLEINQVITSGGTTTVANGTIRNIKHVSTSGGNNRYYFYVTNVTDALFVAGSLTSTAGTIISVNNFTTLAMDSDNKICGDILLNEGDFPTNTTLDIQIRRVTNKKVVASNSFYLGGLLENKTSFSQSARPVQRKLFSNDENIYIDDKTHSINSTTRIINPFHQPFVFSESLFISRLVVRCQNPTAIMRKMIFTIQPMINDNLSPSLVLPFSEKIIDVPASHDGNITIDFEVPIFIPSNSEYAFVFRTENNINMYVKSGTNSILVDSCIPARATAGNASELLQMEVYRAVFPTNEKEIQLYLKDSSFNELVDQYRLNLNTLQLTGTNLDFQWKARNYDTNIKDLTYKTMSPNKTTLVNKRKVFTPADLDIVCKLKSTDARYTPILDLERLTITTIKHHINNGAMLQNNATVTRNTGGTADANLVQLTLSQDAVIGKYPDKICKIDVKNDGSIANFYSDSNFLMYTDNFDVAIQKANTSTGLFENYPYAITTTTSPGTATFSSSNLNINLNLSSEFTNNSLGNAEYRYFSPVVTLGDDFEAMQLFVQMDAVLKRMNEVFVYYRVLENTQPFQNFVNQNFKIMNLLTTDADKYSSGSSAKTLEFESQRITTDPRFKYFQVKICFTSSNFIDIPVVENVRILALDN